MLRMRSKQIMRVFGIFLVCACVCLANASAESDGAALYNKYCTPCHSENGDANTAASRALNPMPRNFTQADFVNDLTRERVIDTVRSGRPGTAMVGWQRRLSDLQIEAVSDYVRQRFGGETKPWQCLSCHGERDTYSLGEEIYQARCYFCHGYDGRANTEAAQYLSPSPKNLHTLSLSLSDLTNAIGQGKEGTAMMSFAKSLSAAEIAAVAVYVDEAFSSPQAGSNSASYHSVENGWPEASLQNFSSADLIKSDACLTCHEAKIPGQTLTWRQGNIGQ